MKTKTFKTHRNSLAMVMALAAFGIANVQANSIDQYAATVIGFSSQYSSGGWSATQVLGAPNTFSYGDLQSAWAPRPINGTNESIAVGFTTPVYADSVTIRETYGNGFVTQIDAIDTSNVLHAVWTGTDPSQPGTPVDFLASWSMTGYLVSGLEIFTNTDHNLQAWEEIDSIQLHGSTVSAVPIPAAVWLVGSGLFMLCGAFRRTKIT